MKEFKTISEVELLNAAYMHVLSKWAHKCDQRQQIADRNPHATKIADHWIARYKSQLDELHARILELEKETQTND